MSAARACAIAFALVAQGCAAASNPPIPLDPQAFVEASERLAKLRAQVAAERTESVRIELDAPYMPSPMSARGAVGVRPPDALRMILVGPGGATAMDLWMGGGRFRFEIPALGRVLTGEPSSQPETRKGLPVDFLRWWMFEPLGGRLLAARKNGGDLELVLDEPGRTTSATLGADGSVRAHRRWLGQGEGGRFVAYEEEWLEASGVGCARATYRQKSTSLKVTATCESSRPSANPAAFEPPEPKAAP